MQQQFLSAAFFTSPFRDFKRRKWCAWVLLYSTLLAPRQIMIREQSLQSLQICYAIITPFSWGQWLGIAALASQTNTWWSGYIGWLIRYSNVNLILRVVGVTMRFESPRQSRFCNFARCIVLNSDVATKTDRIFYDRSNLHIRLN